MAKPGESEERSAARDEASDRPGGAENDYVGVLTARVERIRSRLADVRAEYHRLKDELAQAKAELYVLRLRDLKAEEVEAIKEAAVRRWAASRVEQEFDRHSEGVLRELRRTLEGVLQEATEGMGRR